TLSFAAPEPIRSGDLDEDFVEQIAAALHVERTEILGHQWVDNGPGWAAVRLASAQQVLDLEPDFSQIPDTKLGVLGPHPDDSAHEYEIRAFVPGTAIGEDPVTGSLNASVAQWLIKSGLAPEKYTATQGTALGRAGVISISHEDDEVWVGGPTTVCFKGTAFA
ncbi:MAG: PhzF family phenazine biosynthesis protein, partial [Brevibacterium aurantiacum]|nr:PhzF family phenazine biosynthesis protein [Brevibacterium aurantiacum]